MIIYLLTALFILIVLSLAFNLYISANIQISKNKPSGRFYHSKTSGEWIDKQREAVIDSALRIKEAQDKIQREKRFQDSNYINNPIFDLNGDIIIDDLDYQVKRGLGNVLIFQSKGDISK